VDVFVPEGESAKDCKPCTMEVVVDGASSATEVVVAVMVCCGTVAAELCVSEILVQQITLDSYYMPNLLEEVKDDEVRLADGVFKPVLAATAV
jgi:hypothetical protein